MKFRSITWFFWISHRAQHSLWTEIISRVVQVSGRVIKPIEQYTSTERAIVHLCVIWARILRTNLFRHHRYSLCPLFPWAHSVPVSASWSCHSVPTVQRNQVYCDTLYNNTLASRWPYHSVLQAVCAWVGFCVCAHLCVSVLPSVGHEHVRCVEFSQ